MEPNDDEDKPKKLNEDLVVFMRKRSDHDSPRYTTRLNLYVNFQQKKRKADNARQRENNPHHDGTLKVPPRPKGKKNEPAHNERHSIENRKLQADNARKRENNPHHNGTVKGPPRPKRKNEPAHKERHSMENSAQTGIKENGLKGRRHGPLSLEKRVRISPPAREPSDCSPRRRRRRRCRCRRRRRRRRRRC